MAKLGISTGSSPNDGLGDSLLSGALKINSNFDEIYNAIGNGTSITNTISFANTAFSLSGKPNIDVGFATVSNLDVGVGGSALIVTNDGVIAIGTDTTSADIEIFEKNITIDGSSIIAPDSYIFIQDAEIANLFTYNAEVSGVITASSYIGSGSNLTGIITTILAGENISIAQTGGTLTINSSGGGVGGGVSESYWQSTAAGINTLTNVGIGTTNLVRRLTISKPTETQTSGIELRVVGQISDGNNDGIFFTQTGIGTVPLGSIRCEYKTNGRPNLGFYTRDSDVGGIATESQKLVIGNDGFVGVGTTIVRSKLNVYNGDISIGGTGNFRLPTLNRINLGDGGQTDSSIYFDGSDLRFECPVQIRLGNSTYNYITAASNSGVNLYYGTGDKKLETTNEGVTITGNLVSSGIVTGTNLYASGSIYGYGKNITGIVTSLVAGENITLSSSEGQIIIDASADSAWRATNAGISTLSNVGIGTTNPTSKLSVLGTANINGGLSITGVTTISNGRIQFGINETGEHIKIGNLAGGSGGAANISIGDRALFAANSSAVRNISVGQFSLYNVTTGRYNIAIGDRSGENISTGSSNVIIGSYNGNSGNLDIRTSNNNIVISDGAGNIRQYINSSGNVGIKTTVASEALTVAGVVSATSFYGTLNASQLTGALPAIDGSALIGVVGSGSGVIIEDDATPVGTAGTINFGSNLSVSFGSGIATVSGASSVSQSTTAYGLVGSPNLNVGVVTATSFSGSLIGNVIGNVTGNVTGSSSTSGYATTAGISSAVSGTININTTGIVTATRFVGSGSSLTNLPAGQLTGSLPAIDGSALLNVTASGTGIVVEDDAVNVGSATTIDFGTGIDVSFSAGIATITASGGSLQSRTVVTGVTTSIVNNGIGNTNITGFKSYALMKVGLSTVGWLRLYTDSVSRDNDISRSVGIDPTPGSGVIAEVVTTGISTTQIISPFVMGGNLDDPADTTIYASITNLSGSTQPITANLTILQLEA